MHYFQRNSSYLLLQYIIESQNISFIYFLTILKIKIHKCGPFHVYFFWHPQYLMQLNDFINFSCYLFLFHAVAQIEQNRKYTFIVLFYKKIN